MHMYSTDLWELIHHIGSPSCPFYGGFWMLKFCNVEFVWYVVVWRDFQIFLACVAFCLNVLYHTTNCIDFAVYTCTDYFLYAIVYLCLQPLIYSTCQKEQKSRGKTIAQIVSLSKTNSNFDNCECTKIIGLMMRYLGLFHPQFDPYSHAMSYCSLASSPLSNISHCVHNSSLLYACQSCSLWTPLNRVKVVKTVRHTVHPFICYCGVSSLHNGFSHCIAVTWGWSFTQCEW